MTLRTLKLLSHVQSSHSLWEREAGVPLPDDKKLHSLDSLSINDQGGPGDRNHSQHLMIVGGKAIGLPLATLKKRWCSPCSAILRLFQLCAETGQFLRTVHATSPLRFSGEPISSDSSFGSEGLRRSFEGLTTHHKQSFLLFLKLFRLPWLLHFLHCLSYLSMPVPFVILTLASGLMRSVIFHSGKKLTSSSMAWAS